MAIRDLLQCCGIRPSGGKEKKKIKATADDDQLVSRSNHAVADGYDRCQVWSAWTGWRSRRAHLDVIRRIVFVSRHDTVAAAPLLLTPRSAQPPNHCLHDQHWKVFSLVAAKHLAYTVRHYAQYKQASLVLMLVSAGNERLTLRVCGSGKTIGDWISVLAQLVVPKPTVMPMRRLMLCPVHGMKAIKSLKEEEPTSMGSITTLNSVFEESTTASTAVEEPKTENEGPVIRASPSAPELYEHEKAMTERQTQSLSGDERSTVNPAEWDVTVAQMNKLHAARTAFHAERRAEANSSNAPLSDQLAIRYGPLIEEWSKDTLTVSLDSSDSLWSSESVVDPTEQRSVYGNVPVIEQSFTRAAQRMPPVFLGELEDKLEERRQSETSLMTDVPTAPWSTTVMRGDKSTSSLASISEATMTFVSSKTLGTSELDYPCDDDTQMTSTMKETSPTSVRRSTSQLGMMLVTLHCALYIVAIVAVGVMDSTNNDEKH